MWERLRRLWQPPRAPERPFHLATMDDVHACFRLLLKRRPRPGELPYWQGLIADHQLPLQALVDEFLASAEFLEKQAAASKPQLVDLPGYTLYVRPNDFFVGAAIAREKVYEPAVTRTVRELLRPGDVFLDVGANVGYFTLLAATLVGEGGQVIAFEPNDDNCALIRMSIAANGVGNVVLHPVAVAEKAQTFQLDTAGVGSNGRLIDDSPDAVPGNSPPRPVQAVVLDEVLADAPRLDVVKLDIEGAEPRALQGMTGLLRRHHPVLLTEFAPALIEMTSHTGPAGYLSQLTNLGYSLAMITEEGTRPGTPQEILDAHARSGRSHLDLIGRIH